MSLAAGVIAGTAGASLSNLVLAPLYAANQYIGSFYFGNGMILGERDMYQEDWPKIKLRLDKGESFLSILEEKTTKNTTAVMGNARQIVIQMTPLWYQIVTSYIKNIPKEVIEALNSVINTSIPVPEGNPLDPTSYFAPLAQILTKGITLNVAGLNLGALGNLLPNTPPAEGAGVPPPPPPPIQIETTPDVVDFSITEPNWETITLPQVHALIKKMLRLQLNISQPTIYENALLVKTILTKNLIVEIRNRKPVAKITSEEKGRTSLALQAKLLKYAAQYVKAVKDLDITRKLQAKTPISRATANVHANLRVSVSYLIKRGNNAAAIFNLALKQSRNYKDLTSTWGTVKPLTSIR